METNPEAWVDDHGAYLYRYALAQVRDPQSAEDLVQETFLAALKSLGSFEGTSSFRTWLTGILKHKVLDLLRKKYREQPADTGQLPYETEELFRSEGGAKDHWNPPNGPTELAVDPSDELERREFWTILNQCLDRLPERLRIAFSLREISDLDTGEICKDLDITPTNLWVMLHRARMQVRRCIELKWNH